MIVEENHLYTITDEFFVRFPDENLKYNKDHRPHLFCYRDTNTGLLWVIPTSNHGIEKQRAEIAKAEARGHREDILRHVAQCNNNEVRAFFIRDMFPVSDRYIEHAYTRGGVEGALFVKKDIEAIRRKSQDFLSKIRAGVSLQKYQIDILYIESELIKDKETKA